MPWAVIISLAVLSVALVIKYLLEEIIEEQSPFFVIIGVFFVIYVVAALAVGSLNPISAITGPAF